MAWLTGDVDFQAVCLSLRPLPILNEIYHVSIVCRARVLIPSGSMKENDFMMKSLDVILQVICKQSNLKLEKSDNMIYLSAQ